MPTEQKFLGGVDAMHANQLIYVDVRMCNSCGYAQEFNKLKEYLEIRYSNISVRSSDYPLKFKRKVMSKFAQFLQYGLLALILFAHYIFPAMGLPIPEMLLNLDTKKKMMFMFGIIFLGG